MMGGIVDDCFPYVIMELFYVDDEGADVRGAFWMDFLEVVLNEIISCIFSFLCKTRSKKIVLHTEHARAQFFSSLSPQLACSLLS